MFLVKIIHHKNRIKYVNYKTFSHNHITLQTTISLILNFLKIKSDERIIKLRTRYRSIFRNGNNRHCPYGNQLLFRQTEEHTNTELNPVFQLADITAHLYEQIIH